VDTVGTTGDGKTGDSAVVRSEDRCRAAAAIDDSHTGSGTLNDYAGLHGDVLTVEAGDNMNGVSGGRYVYGGLDAGGVV
jgi:hypothetical protein